MPEAIDLELGFFFFTKWRIFKGLFTQKTSPDLGEEKDFDSRQRWRAEFVNSSCLESKHFFRPPPFKDCFDMTFCDR